MDLGLLASNKIMITLKEFKEAVHSLRKINDQVDSIYTSYKIDLSEMDSVMEGLNLFDLFIGSHFTEAGCDCIYGWLYEDVDKVIAELKNDVLNDEGCKDITLDIFGIMQYNVDQVSITMKKTSGIS